MKNLCLSVTAGLILAVPCFGLELEGHIVLPDSFGNVKYPGWVACNTVNDRVYVGGGENSECPRLLVVDGATDERSGAIPVPDELAALLYEPSVNKLYVVGAYRDSLLVIDGTTNQLIVALEVTASDEASLATDPARGRLYYASDNEELVVVDLHGDSVITRFGVNVEPAMVCVNPASNRVLLPWGHDFLTVVDAAGDSVLRLVRVLGDQTDACYNPVNNTVYVAALFDPGIWVVGGPRDTIIDSIPGIEDVLRLAFNPADNRVYCAYEDGVAVIDAATNTLLQTIPAGGECPALAVNPDENKVYVSGYPALTIIDCATGQVIDTFPAVFEAGERIGLAYSPASRKVYCTLHDGDLLMVVDGAGDTITALVNTADVFEPGCVDIAGGRVYGFDLPTGEVLAIDCAAGSVAARIPGRPYAEAMEFHPAGNKLYCTYYENDSLAVLDCAGDTLLKRVDLGAGMGRLLYHRPADKLYCSTNEWYTLADSAVRVVDCGPDELVATVALPGRATDLCSDPLLDKVYCAALGGYPGPSFVVAIDPQADTLLGTVEVCSRPVRLCHDPVNSRIYAALAYCESLAVIDCAGDSLERYVPLPREVWQAVFSPVANKLYLCADSELVVVDCAADTVLRIIAIDAFVTRQDPSYDSVGNRLYVVAGSPRAVYAVDCALDSVLDRVETETWVGSAIWNPANRRLYCSTWEEGRIAVLSDYPQGIEGPRGSMPGPSAPTPTICRGILLLPSDLSVLISDFSLMDISGRRALDLHPGPNDIRHLSPGIYFIREESARTTRKVIVAK